MNAKLLAVLLLGVLSPQVVTTDRVLASNTLQPSIVVQGSLAQAGQTAEYYIDRGVVKYKANDFQGAIAEFNRAIAVNPKEGMGYNGRGLAKYSLGDKQGALADFDRALELNPKEILAYNIRGFIRSEVGNHRGAIDDFSRSIAIDATQANAYNGRGLAKYKLGDKVGAIADLTKSAQLFNQQGDTEMAGKITSLLKILNEV